MLRELQGRIAVVSWSGSTNTSRCAWVGLAGLTLILAVLVACVPDAQGPGPTSFSSPTSLPTDTPTSPPTWMATPFPTSVPPSPVPTLTSLPLVPTATPEPFVTPTSFPDEQGIVDAVLGIKDPEHWAIHRVSGSFTTAAAEEQVALVGNMGEQSEIRWVVVAKVGDTWRLRGTSELLGMGFDAPLPNYFPPDVLDFDGDGRQEMVSHYFNMQFGWMASSDALYRWDGSALRRIWGAPTLVDNRLADSADVPQLYREDYQATWEWADMDGDGLPEIRLREHIAFYLPGEEGYVADDAPSVGEESGELAFRWDGEAFRPYGPDGPNCTFAFVESGDLWLWQDHIARPLGVEHVGEFYWTPDGERLIWWAQPPAGGVSRDVTLGIYDLSADTGEIRRGDRWAFALDGVPSALSPVPDGRLAYALPGRPVSIADPGTGRQEAIPAASIGTWSPDGSRMTWEQDGDIYIYDFSSGKERPLATAAGDQMDLRIFNPIWSPRGDWIACLLENRAEARETTDDGSLGLIYVGLVSPDPPQPLSASDLLGGFDGWEASALQLAWSPDGSHLAAVAYDPRLGRHPTVVYLSEVGPGENDPIGRPDWREVLRLEAVTRTVGLAWSPDGERVTLAVGSEVWEVDAAGGAAVLRRRFLVPELEWTALEWAPDGSGYLVGLKGPLYEGHLYWFPADGSGQVLLLTGALGPAHWPPREVRVQGVSGGQGRPPMVLIEYTDDDPLVHFVGENGSDTVVPAMGGMAYLPFQIGGGRVYYDNRYVDQEGVVSFPVPDALDRYCPPLVSPDGGRLAWLCDDGPPDLSALINGTAEIHFHLIVTDGLGGDPREVWSHVETGPDYRSVRLTGWRLDGEMVYLSRPRYGTAWAYFDYNPGMLALHVPLDIGTGAKAGIDQAVQIGDLEGVHDGRVSADGTWLAQSSIAEWPGETVTITLRSLVDGVERSIPCAEETVVAGDFSFSPDSAWMAWREWATGPDSSTFLVRALRLPDGEPFTVYEDVEQAAPHIGGWLSRDDLVLVYPVQEDGTGGYSTVVTLPAVGPGSYLSPFAFLGVW